MTTAHAVANWIVRYRAADLGVPVDPMALQKHLVYAQCFYLALTGEPLFADEVKAWRDGLVVPAVWKSYSVFGAGPIELDATENESPEFDESKESFLKDLVHFFGRHTALTLSDAVHCEEPWQRAREGYLRREPSDVWVKKRELRSYYAGLIADGEEALSRHEMLSVAPDPRWGHYYVAGICARRMSSHPFFDWELAQELANPVADQDGVPEGAYAPATRDEYIEISGTSDMTLEQIVQRAREAAR